jgi:conjugative transposon TraK protein
MFKRTKNIETAFQSIRLLCLVTIISAMVFSGYVAYESNEKVMQSQNRVYILALGKAMEALASDRKDNIPVEARDHIKVFHQDFFSLDPDEKVIGANITRALYLADESAKRMYDNLKESGYYANIISGNISQEITVDSISLDMGANPFYFRCYATQKIVRTSSIAIRDLITEGWLRSVSRSDNNPHGFLIERWNTIENKDLKIINR